MRRRNRARKSRRRAPDLPVWLSDLVQELALKAPTDRPVRVRIAKLGVGVYGDCNRFRDHYRVRLGSRAGREEETLLHEWAHALAWHEREQHGPAWGVAYARLLTLRGY